jgi:hypothetical protein
MKKLNSMFLVVIMFFYGFTALSPALAFADNDNGKKNNSEVKQEIKQAKQEMKQEIKDIKKDIKKISNWGSFMSSIRSNRNSNKFFNWFWWNRNFNNNDNNDDRDGNRGDNQKNKAFVTTKPATGVTSASATVNGIVGLYNASDTSFWLGTTSAGPFASSTDPSSQLPSGWAGVDSLVKTAGGSFSYAYTSLTPSTKYYFVAWVLVGGVWHPGSVMSFKTSTTTPPSDTVSPNIIFATNIGSNSSTTSVIWVTNEASDSKIWVGTASPVSTTTTPTATSATLSYFHQLNLPVLVTSTLYYYSISSTDASNNTTYYSNSFTTPAI